jgi:hypothetical protein
MNKKLKTFLPLIILLTILVIIIININTIKNIIVLKTNKDKFTDLEDYLSSIDDINRFYDKHIEIQFTQNSRLNTIEKNLIKLNKIITVV